MNESPDKMRSRPSFAVFYLIAAISCFLSAPAFATCRGAPSVTQTSTLDFSTVQIPATTATLTIAPNPGSTTSGTGELIYGAASNGRYIIGSGGGLYAKFCSWITINITGVSCGVSGCSLGSWTGRYGGLPLIGNPPWVVPAPLGIGNVLTLGTTATYNSTVRAGTYAPAFSISVHYNAEPAATFPQMGSLAFDHRLSIDTLSDISFGQVETKAAASYMIDTSGTVTATGNGQWINGPTSAGRLLIHGSATQTISISAGSYEASGTGGGVELSNAVCSYNGGAPKPCALTTQAPPTAAGKTLLLGATVKVNKTQTDSSTATPSFTITVTYT